MEYLKNKDLHIYHLKIRPNLNTMIRRTRRKKMDYYKKIYATVILWSMGTLSYAHSPEKSADLLIFSFHRPLQLHATLESVYKYFSNLNQIYVLYRTTNSDYDNAYNELRHKFSHVKFIKQSGNHRGDFKPLLLQCFFDSPAEYILFSVDDDIATDYVDFDHCIQAMQETNAYGFYLRLGTNIIKNYKAGIEYTQPPFTQMEHDILKFQFNKGTGDWAYPNNIDMTIFKKSKIEHYLLSGPYSSPNTLEGHWYPTDLNFHGLCFKTSKKFMLPLNIVQEDWYVPNENSYSIHDLFLKWKAGLIIDINQFYKIENDCVLMGYNPTFIYR
jgi:hypothetical protein